jgi:hypothetical protein
MLRSCSSIVSIVAQPLQLAAPHQREQPCLERSGELKGQSQVRMPGRKREDLGSDVCLDAEPVEEVQVVASGVPIPAGPPERLHDQGDQLLERGGWRVEVPGGNVWVFQHYGAALKMLHVPARRRILTLHLVGAFIWLQ